MSALEQHYTPQQLAERWGMTAEKVRQLFKDEAGVIRLGDGTRRHGRAFIRRYVTLRIPESVAFRVHGKLLEKK